MKNKFISFLALTLVFTLFLSSCRNEEQETDSSVKVTEPMVTELFVTVDNFIGREYSEKLYKELVDGYYDVNVEFKYSEKPANTVIGQSIPSGDSKEVSVDDPDTYIDITITVSKGIQNYALPDYSGQRKEDVISDLRSKNLTVLEDDIITEYNDEYEAGEVISTQPAAGTTVKMHDEVKLVVSKGKEMEAFTVPDFKNMTRKEVENILEDVKFKKIVYVEEYSDTVEKGCIIEQSQPPETVLTPETSKIEITISLGPDPTKE